MTTKKNLYLNRPLLKIPLENKDTLIYTYKGIRSLSEQAIKDFQDLHERKFGKKLTVEEAERDFTLLLRIVELINKTRI